MAKLESAELGMSRTIGVAETTPALTTISPLLLNLATTAKTWDLPVSYDPYHRLPSTRVLDPQDLPSRLHSSELSKTTKRRAPCPRTSPLVLSLRLPSGVFVMSQEGVHRWHLVARFLHPGSSSPPRQMWHRRPLSLDHPHHWHLDPPLPRSSRPCSHNNKNPSRTVGRRRTNTKHPLDKRVRANQRTTKRLVAGPSQSG